MPSSLLKRFEPATVHAWRAQARASVRRAVEVIGSQRQLACQLSARLAAQGQPIIRQQSVQEWITAGTLVNERYWRHIEELTGYRVTRRHLRPDLYPPDPGEVLFSTSDRAPFVAPPAASTVTMMRSLSGQLERSERGVKRRHEAGRASKLMRGFIGDR